MSASDLAQIAGVAVTILAAWLSFHFSKRAERYSSRQLLVEINAFRLEYFRDLRAWADEVIEVMAEAVLFCELTPKTIDADDFDHKKFYLKRRLSALTDRGRWFLPNVQEDAVGQEREAAYRGFRQPALDKIIDAYNLIQQFDDAAQTSNGERRAALKKAQRLFASEIQTILDPRTLEKELKRLAESERAAR